MIESPNDIVSNLFSIVDSNWHLFAVSIPVAWAIRRIFATDVKAFLNSHKIDNDNLTAETYLQFIKYARGGTRLFIDSIGVLLSSWALRALQLVALLGLVIQLVRYATGGTSDNL